MTREIKGFDVLILLLGFFGITIAVNVAMSVYAIETFSGEDVSSPYLKGLAYNGTLREREAQAALGWALTVDAARRGERGVTVTVRIADRSGLPKASLTVATTLRRPTNAAMDRTVDATDLGGGVYRAVLSDVAPGQWDVVVKAADGHGGVLEADRRVMIP